MSHKEEAGHSQHLSKGSKSSLDPRCGRCQGSPFFAVNRYLNTIPVVGGRCSYGCCGLLRERTFRSIVLIDSHPLWMHAQCKY